MAIKSQDQCYRTFDGVRWPNYSDMHSMEEELHVASLRAVGCRMRVRSHPSGFRIAFIHPDDLARISDFKSSALQAEQGAK